MKSKVRSRLLGVDIFLNLPQRFSAKEINSLMSSLHNLVKSDPELSSRKVTLAERKRLLSITLAKNRWVGCHWTKKFHLFATLRGRWSKELIQELSQPADKLWAIVKAFPSFSPTSLRCVGYFRGSIPSEKDIIPILTGMDQLGKLNAVFGVPVTPVMYGVRTKFKGWDTILSVNRIKREPYRLHIEVNKTIKDEVLGWVRNTYKIIYTLAEASSKMTEIA